VEFSIPASLELEHQELHAELARGTREPGRLGEAAKNVAKLLDPHFEKEEEYALPPLGLLSKLADEKVVPALKEVLVMTDKLKTDLPEMLEEHKAIIVALSSLVNEAKKANKPEYAHFAEKLTLHARNEEEVLYPASLLVGEFIKLRTQPARQTKQ
jgi:hypothetical protein